MNGQVTPDNRSVVHTAKGRVLVSGQADAQLCATRNMISFWGGYDPATGVIIDQHHPLSGTNLTGKIFALPKGKGSSTGSAVLLDALQSGHAPAAIILNKVDEIIALGVVVFEEFFGQKIPVVQLDDADFEAAFGASSASIAEDGTVTLYE
ncbi:aconitase X swivel domain-containing protein [Pseudomonas sp. NPDC089547]|uniref:aconitase X swivel domain-containing protein n=1 Tax=Pseudomonas sp. NPDC089547 TaxID=3390652 RepID=UPI003D03FEAF